MKKTKHSEENSIGAVKEFEAGRPVKEVARELKSRRLGYFRKANPRLVAEGKAARFDARPFSR